MILRIRDWDRHFENAASRKLKRLDWVAIPNKTDGEGYTALVDHPDAAAHLGAWYAIVEAASKQNPRGQLPSGIPHTIGGICQSLGRMSRLPGGIFQAAIPRLIEIGWLECIQQDTDVVAESPNVVAESPNVVAESPNVVAAQGRELQGITGKGTTTTTTAQLPPPLQTQTEWPLTTAELVRHDPATDQTFVMRLVQTTCQMLISNGDMEMFDDEDMESAIRESYDGYHGKRAHGNGLLLSRVPQIMLNWGKNEKK